MNVVPLMENLEFGEKDPKAEPLFVAPDGRIIRFALRPGQVIREHNAPHSPVYVVVQKGQGIFAGADGKEQRVGPNTVLTFDTGEDHSIRAEGEELVIVAFLREAPGVGQFPSRTASEHQSGRRQD